MISLTAFLYVELAAAALLSAWTIVRFPRLGPGSLTKALLLFFAVDAAGYAVPHGLKLVLSLPDGVYVALIGVVLPLLVAMFLTTGWFLRAALGLAGGSGGGGHPISDASR